ncbi:MAG: glutamate synthase homotetrameric [Symbiobacteriaceae bacterium]|jgi:glutamate synthase (NADPH/NADH) small chain|nr:glutamate synthase homotetrameric [Symbiobacteriaceae bacterium]
MAKMKRDRHPMPLLDAAVRVNRFDEVALGYTLEMAIEEAQRCLKCKNPTCEIGCPVQSPVKDFVALLAEGKVAESVKRLREVNRLPAICGRVCPQEEQCESKCVMGVKFEPVAIGRLERFVADWERQHGFGELEPVASRGVKVAVVGAGPAGLTCAGDLAALGYQVTVFEALHAAGGVLMYGIPEFRLPKEIVETDVRRLEEMGVEFRYNVLVGRTVTIDDLMEKDGYSAVFIGTGAGLPKFMGIPGENYSGVYSANEFLTRINLLRAYKFPEYDTPLKVGKRVAVIGAGNTAMDSVRTALRVGAEQAMIVYRRTEHEMTARREEFEHAEEEGVQFNFLTNPVEILANEDGWVTGLKCVKMELGEPDESGRRKPVTVKGSEFVMPVDTVIMALGTTPNPILLRTTPGLQSNKWGCVVADPETGATTRPGVFAGGDAVTGAATVILAMGAGQKAARAIHEYLEKQAAVHA